MLVTKSEFKQLKYLNNEIRMLQEELRRCSYDMALQSPSLKDGGRGSEISDTTAKTAEKIGHIKSIIEMKLLEVQRLREKLISYINTVDDSLIRQILHLRYVSGLCWIAVAAQTGGYNSPDNLRIMLDRFFKRASKEEAKNLKS